MDVEKDELPKGWAWARLEDITSRVGTVDARRLNGSFPYVDVQSINNARAVVDEVREVTPEDAPSRAKHAVRPGDLIVSTVRTYLRNTALIPEHLEHAIASTAFCALRPCDGVSSRYLYYRARQDQFVEDLTACQRGNSPPACTDDDVRAQLVPVAPSTEQTRIADKIDELFSDIDEGERGLRKVQALLKKHRQAVLKAAVTGELTRDWRDRHGPPAETGPALLTRILAARRAAWEADQQAKAKAAGKMLKGEAWKAKYEEPQAADLATDILPADWCWACVDQLGLVVGGITKNSKREAMSLKVPYLRVANVYAGRLDLSNVQEIGLNSGELTRSSLRPNDILVVEGNGSLSEVGRAAVWRGEISPCVHQNHIIRVRPVLPEMATFLVTWMASPSGRAMIEEKASSTSGLHTLSLSKVGRIAVPVPPLEEQQQVMDRVEEEMSKIDAMEAVVADELKRSARLRQSILKAAFTGKLVPQNRTDEPAEVLLARLREERAAPAQPKRRGRGSSQDDAPQPGRPRGRPRKVG